MAETGQPGARGDLNNRLRTSTVEFCRSALGHNWHSPWAGSRPFSSLVRPSRSPRNGPSAFSVSAGRDVVNETARKPKIDERLRIIALPPERAWRKTLSLSTTSAKLRAVDQGGERGDQLDALVMPLLRRQRRAPSTSRARL
jgi:hypothetical protein